MPRDKPIKVTVPKEKGTSTTISGAISNKRAGIYYKATTGTTEANTKNYFVQLFNSGWVGDLSKTVIVMDNHSAHKTYKLLEYIHSKKVTVLFTPTASSALNPVVSCFAF